MAITPLYMRILRKCSLFILLLASAFIKAGNTPADSKITKKDTLQVRLNGKPYFAIKVNGAPPIYNGQIIFNPLRVTDTGSISLKCFNSKSELVQMMRNGDTIQN
jgi:hypothetical protein